MMSLSPLATRVGWVIPARRLRRVESGMPQVSMALRWASRVARLTGASRSSRREPSLSMNFPAPGLAGGGLLEEYGQQVLGHRGVLDGDLQDDAGEDVHVPPAPGAGAGEDDPAGLVRADQGDFLGDEPAEREAEQVIPPEPESVGERYGV